MKNIKLLSRILKKSNNLIKSEDYKESYKIGNSFSRKRKLSFSNAIYFICSALRKSLSAEINKFIEEHSYLNFPDISKQAFSKARQNISPEAFKELCRLFVDTFYDSDINIRKWKGFNVFAIDGTSLQIPDTPENVEYFGCKSNQSNTKTALASSSALYDVLNDIVIDATISTFPADERGMAKQHINSINNTKLFNNTIIVFDRGYPSYDMFSFLDKKGLFFLMRVSSAFKLTKSTTSNDSVVQYKIEKNLKELRVIKLELPDGSIETLVTNIFSKTIDLESFKELYFLRWGVEGKYKELKSSIQIEEFSGNKPIAIQQDFYASIYLSMITSLLKKDADIAITIKNKEKTLKSSYQANRNFILVQVFKNIPKLLTKPILGKRILEKILEKAIKIRSQIRPNRSCERKNKHPRKKHHFNIKSCV